MGRHKPRGRPNRRRDKGPGDGAQGRFWLYGQHAVAAALANEDRVPERLLATRESAEKLALDPKTLAAAMEICGREDIEQVLPHGAVHQGLALFVRPLPARHLETVVAEAPERAVIMVLDQVTDPQNVGAILRSAAVFGAAAVVLPARNAAPETGALAKAASGALEAVPLVRVSNLARALESLKEAGFWLVGLDAEAEAGIETAPLDGRAALVMGAEGTGLRRLTAEHCDLLARLPMPENGIGSLNVSAAAAIALYEAARRQN